MLKAYLAEKKELVEKNLQKILDRYKKPELYSEAMKYAVMNGGKRLRPILMYMMCDLFEKKYENIEDIACALEFIHCYSLVHDDLPAMDNDMYRRGKLTTHVKYGEAEGILVGDVLLTEAFNIVANSPAISDSNKVKIIAKLSEYSGFYGMAGGQFADMKSEHVKVSFETLKYIHAHKTGKLLTAAIELPLIAFDTQKEKRVLNVESKVEDVTQAILTMAKGSTKSKEVNEITKQIISEVVSEEYRALGINSNPSSLYEDTSDKSISNNFLGSKKKKMPTLGSWYRRLEKTAEESTNDDYRFHFSYLLKVMKQYIRDFGGQLAYFDGQSTFDLGDHVPFINLDISQLEERFARPLAQQILLSWVWEKYVKKNSEDKKKANKKRVIVDEAWMLLPFPEAVDFLNTMARRARKRNVSLALVSQRFQDFYEMSAVQAVLTSSDTKLFLAQDNAEIDYIRETFKLSEGEASFLATATVGKGLLKIGDDTTILSIEPTQMEFEFVDTNINTKVERENAKAKEEEN